MPLILSASRSWNRTPPHCGGVFSRAPASWRHDLGVFALALAACSLAFLLFRPALSGPFVFDDLSNISHLALIDGVLTRDSLGTYLYSFSGSLGRPLSALSFLINDWGWPTDPRSFKYTNLLLHLINGLLVFALVSRLAREHGSGRPHFIALATMAMWLLAPLQVASVMLTVQRMALLSASFTLAGLLLHVASMQSTKPVDSLRAFLILARLALFTVLAFLCKENGALVPLLAACLHGTILRCRTEALPATPRRVLLLGIAAPWVAILLYFAWNPAYVLGGYGAGREFTLTERLYTEARVLWEYVANILVPRIGGHGIFHDDYVISTSALHPLTTLPSIAGWAAALACAFGTRRIAPWLSFSILWFLAAHAMESTVISLEIYFEHRNYVAMIGPLLLVALGLGELKRHFGYGLLVIWLTFAALATHSNAKVWGSAQAMANVWHAEHPDSVRAIQLKASSLTDRGQFEAAIDVLEEGHRRLPSKAELFLQTLPLRCATGTMSEALLPAYRAAVASARTTGIPANQLADLRGVSRNCDDHFTVADWWELTDLLLANPRMRASRNAMSHIHYQRGQAAVESGDLDAAIKQLDLAYAAEPNPFIPREQADYLVSAGLFDDALRYLEKSEATPVSFWKRHTFNAGARNLRLREAIEQARRHDPRDGT